MPLIMIIGSTVAFVIVLGAVVFVLVRFVRSEMKMHQSHFLEMARQQFMAEQNKAATEWETRRQAVDSSVAGLKEELERYRQMVREFEKERDTQYGGLANELKNASQATTKLQDTTLHLNNILGNVKLRGQWGERMADDIIRFAGLIEGVNYIKQKQMNQTASKPDFTFLLPEKFKINMDVKFPLNNYVRMTNTQEAGERERLEKDFFQNVKDRIKEIQDRGYINPAEHTLDFVLLFIPNEQVFGFIQEKHPELLDMALAQKVVLCSPFTLYAMLSIIRKAHENFRYEKDIRKIITLIEQFASIYVKFKDRFEKLGDALDKLETQYRDVRDKSFRQLDTKIRHIDEYKKGHPEIMSEATDVLDLPPPEQTHEADSSA